jgi:hypothetical protein
VAKLNSKIINEIVESFDRVGGAAYLDELALRDPPTYTRLLMRVIPNAVTIETTDTLDLGELMTEANARAAKLRQNP